MFVMSNRHTSVQLDTESYHSPNNVAETTCLKMDYNPAVTTTVTTTIISSQICSKKIWSAQEK